MPSHHGGQLELESEGLPQELGDPCRDSSGARLKHIACGQKSPYSVPGGVLRPKVNTSQKGNSLDLPRILQPLHRGSCEAKEAEAEEWGAS